MFLDLVYMIKESKMMVNVHFYCSKLYTKHLLREIQVRMQNFIQKRTLLLRLFFFLFNLTFKILYPRIYF